MRVLFFYFFICYAFTSPAFAYEDLIASYSDIEDQLEIEKGTGTLIITIESFAGKNFKRFSQKATRIEVWSGSKRIASINAKDAKVTEENRRKRVFTLPEIKLDSGYYFVNIRLFHIGVFSAREKWNGKIFQVGIHPEKVSRVTRTIPFFVW
jgi:hypothetical protein